ncbi:MAG: hypothetical protein RM368_32975 [Nostoc sp. DedSLP03]|uniref:hypothetical protein n=1 Tax=Nostoc sp. DedSLP03 TaxID=3075400 RepID=UPI002AD5829A|nr:hypothetical protein [Nostoc sp. DedSLP03]MDZ7969704.1 hypothetical protein [Nostoc sp. DedSLP03]
MYVKRVLKKGVTYLYLVDEPYNPEKKRGETKYRKSLGIEESIAPPSPMTEEFAIVWAEGRTLGNAVPFSERVKGMFPEADRGTDAILPCDIVPCGKFRNGAQRWWCRTHQMHWGTKADIQQVIKSEGIMECSNKSQPMHYVKKPLVLNPSDYAGGVGIWAALPTAINTTDEPDTTEVQIHVHARPDLDGQKSIDRNYPVVVITAPEPSLPLFSTGTVKRVAIAPPYALAYLEAVVKRLPLDTLYCHNCQHPHLDLGDFALNPHKKHFCGNCGVDSNWSSRPIISSPIYELAANLSKNTEFINSERTLDLSQYQGCQFKLWASTPAILWTSEMPQEAGIHVHIYQNGSKIVDNTFGQVLGTDGTPLDREQLLLDMLKKTQKQEQTRCQKF